MIRRAPALVLIAAMLLAGCGFSPMYAVDTGVAPKLAGVEVETSEGREDYLVGVALRDRLGSWQGDRALYVLRTAASPSRASTALTVDQVASRLVLSVSVQYALYDRASGQRLTSGSVLGQASYDVPGEPYAAVRAESESAERAASDAADRLTLALASYFREQGAP